MQRSKLTPSESEVIDHLGYVIRHFQMPMDWIAHDINLKSSEFATHPTFNVPDFKGSHYRNAISFNNFNFDDVELSNEDENIIASSSKDQPI